MVGAVVIPSAFTDETALSLYRKNVFPDFYHPPASAPPLIPEIVEEREITASNESFNYDRFGQMNRISVKGVFVDSYY